MLMFVFFIIIIATLYIVIFGDAINSFLKNKEIIVPGIINKFVYVLNKIIPNRITRYIVYMSQNGKRNY